MTGWRLMQQGRDAVARCRHCDKPIRRVRFPNATGDPYMWIHRDGSRPRCARELSSPYAEPKEQP